jgi:lysophospholipase L1-like esterase
MRKLLGSLSLVFILCLSAQRADADDFFFQPKDRIVFLGDSITEQYDYTNVLEYYLVTRFPAWDLQVYNAGIGGDTAGGGNNRAARDVLSEKPTAVTINFGMNDGGYKAPDDKVSDNYFKNQTALVKKLTDARVRVALMSTSPVEGRKRKDGETYNETLGKFADGLKEMAGKNQVTYVDQFHPSLRVLRKLNEDKTAFDCFPDSVHTNGRGGLLMAHSILTAMHAPATVSGVALSADGNVTATERCKVSDVKTDGGKLSFTRTDEALPMVPTPDQKALLPYLDDLSKLNRYGLKVTGLDRNARYELSIDGKKVAMLTGGQLNEGVNLAVYELGPIGAQSTDAWKALVEKNQVLKYRFNTFRRGAGALPTTLTADERKEWDELRERQLSLADKDLEVRRQRMYELAQPKPHRFELTPLP